MALSHQILFVTGVLFLLSILAGILSARVGTPLLLVFICVGILAGVDGPGGIRFDDFQATYLVGSVALALILFEGGLATQRRMLKRAFWPAMTMATVGVAVSAMIVAGAIVLVFKSSWPEAMLLGAVTAPTDAAAVAVLLRSSGAMIPSRVVGLLEVESGLNDPMSVFLTTVLVEWLLQPAGLTFGHAVFLLLMEMGGGIVFGFAGGYALLLMFRHLRMDVAVSPVLAVGGALALFGGTQSLGASGFLAVYIAGFIVGNHPHAATASLAGFFRALGWLAQISLFLILGLLVTPHDLVELIPAALVVTAVLVLIARPVSAALCLSPFGFKPAETAFISWVGLRGAVPIFLTIIPELSGVHPGGTLFGIVFVTVIVSVAIQGWTMAPVARLLKLQAEDP